MKTLLNTFLLFFIINIAAYFYLENVLVSSEHSENNLINTVAKLKITYPDFSNEEITQLIREDYASRINYYSPLLETRPPYMNGRYVNYTKEGYRKIKDQKKYNKQDFNIYLFGGSTTFGTSVRDEDTIASSVSLILKEKSNCNKSISVFNYGTPGHFSSQEFIRFQELLREDKKPNIAIFIDGLNDFFRYDDTTFTSFAVSRQMRSLNEQAIPAHYEYAFGKDFTQKIFKIPGELKDNFEYKENITYRFILDFKKSLYGLPIVKLAQYINGTTFSPMPMASFAGTNFVDNKEEKAKVVMNRLVHNHNNIKLVANSHGIKTLFVLQPTQVINYDLKHSVSLSQSDYNNSVHLQFIKYGYQYLEKNNYTDFYESKNFLDLTNIQKNEKRNLYVDPAHYNPYFSNKIALHIVKKIINSNFISCKLN